MYIYCNAMKYIKFKNKPYIPNLWDTKEIEQNICKHNS